jgi:hypothetical protein
VIDVLEAKARTTADPYFSVEGQIIRASSSTHELVFLRNLTPVYPRPPVLPPSQRI